MPGKYFDVIAQNIIVTNDGSSVVIDQEWELTYVPIEDTLIVFVDFVEFLDWTYNTATNSVEFTTIPPEGSHVEIGYVIDHGAGDDDDSAGDDDDSSGN